MANWQVWPEALHYKVATRLYSNWAGSAYKFARRNGCIVRFLRRKSAQRYADELNARELAEHSESLDDSRLTEAQ